MTQLEDKYNEQDAHYVQRRQKQVKNVRYMVYCFVMGILLLIFQPLFSNAVDKVRGEGAAKQMISLKAWNPINNLTKARGEGGLLNEVDRLNWVIDTVITESSAIEGVIAIVNQLDNQQKQNTIATCLNAGQCDGVPASLKPYLTLLRNYIILDRLEGEKMDFNQKMVLKSINQFLIKNSWTLAGTDIAGVNFTPPSLVDPALNLYRLPFTLTVDFQNEAQLFTFLTNVDTKMTFELPILYAIDKVGYDAMEYEDPQTVTITMSAYYYVGAPKNIVKEHASADGKDGGDLWDLAELMNGEGGAEIQAEAWVVPEDTDGANAAAGDTAGEEAPAEGNVDEGKTDGAWVDEPKADGATPTKIKPWDSNVSPTAWTNVIDTSKLIKNTTKSNTQ